MVILYLNHYAAPPSAGGIGRPGLLAKELSRLGHRMIVACAGDHHIRSKPAAPESLHRIVVDGGVEFLQLPVRPYCGNGLKRLLNNFDYCKQIKGLGAAIAQGTIPKPDVIIGSSAPLFVFDPARQLARELGVPLIFEVRDIWPLTLVEVVGVSRWHPLILWMALIERRAYRRADAVVSLLPNGLEHMGSRGLTPDRFFCVSNGIDLTEWSGPFPELPAQHRELFSRLRREGKVIVLYSGSHAPSDALDQVLDLNKVLGAAAAPYHFVLIGDGVAKPGLMARAEQECCDFIDFLPRVTKAQSLAAIQEADLCYLGWHDKPIYRFGISPNKLSEYMYAGKPVVHAVGETVDPVSIAQAGVSVRPFDPQALDAALRSLCAMSPEQRCVVGGKGRNYVLKNLEWSVLAGKYMEVIGRVISRKAGKQVAG